MSDICLHGWPRWDLTDGGFSVLSGDWLDGAKPCEVTFARLQGMGELLSRFAESPIAKEPARYQPVVIDPVTGGQASLAQVQAEMQRKLFVMKPKVMAVVARMTAAQQALPKLLDRDTETAGSVSCDKGGVASSA